MAKTGTNIDPDQQTNLVHNRIYLTAALTLLLTLIILYQVFHLQVVRHDHFTTLSKSNHIKILPVVPSRGLIFSSDGILLADNRPSFTLELVPERIPDIESAITQISRLVMITPDDMERFRELRKRSRRFEGIPLRFNLSDEEVAVISVNRHLLPGVDVVASLSRHYPLAGSLSHTVGYVGMIDKEEFEKLNETNYHGTTYIGKSGIEKAYEDLLHGHAGYQQVEVNVQGRKIREIYREPPEPSKNLHLTIDASLQILAVRALNGRRGAIVAMDTRTGAVLASASSPGYDPNLFVDGIDSNVYGGLLRSKDTPLLNRALQGKYPPGSTIKPMLALGSLKLRVREPANETWCPGWYSLRGSTRRYRDWKKEGHGHVDMVNAIAQSCDVYFYVLARDMGIDRIHQTLMGFGFGKPTGIDIGGEAAGLIPSTQWKREALGQPWYPGETLIAGIGQGATLVTPIQLVAATAVVANRGRQVRPYLLSEVRDSVTGQLVIKAPDQAAKPVISTDIANWDVIIHSMEEVLHGTRGTARASGAGAEYHIAGKTGTAQVISIGQDEEYNEDEIPEEFRDHALFIAFAPVEAPEIAMAVIVENGGGGSRTAAPIARELLDHYFHRKKRAGTG
ncbi:MAG: penicillin-binding protein 2 [Gammaproteobacteria bacterium]|nr:penicillin-binding protein 2 [Gammaproteobacteria bacterium]MDE0511538.1 penicillin-binding protein 2 [Gammaproteobacteria bacterium]